MAEFENAVVSCSSNSPALGTSFAARSFGANLMMRAFVATPEAEIEPTANASVSVAPPVLFIDIVPRLSLPSA